MHAFYFDVSCSCRIEINDNRGEPLECLNFRGDGSKFANLILYSHRCKKITYKMCDKWIGKNVAYQTPNRTIIGP